MPFTPYKPTSNKGFTPYSPVKSVPQVDQNVFPKEEPQAVKQSFFQKLGGAIENFGIGAYKGAASTVSNISSLGQKGLDTITKPISEAITGKPYQSTPTLNETFEGTTAITPTSTAQKVGFGAEQVGEFFIPGGATAKAEKAAELAAGGSKLAKIAGLGAKVATEAGVTAGITATQGGNKQDIKNAGVIGGGLSLVSGGLGKILEKVPESAWKTILKRTPSMAIKNPDLAGQAAKTGLTGLTRDSLSVKAGNAIQSIEIALDDLFKSTSDKKIATLKIAPYLDELRNAYSKIPGEQNSLEAINNVARDFLSKKTLTPLEANEMKRAIYQNISNSYGKGVLDIPAKADAQKAIARGLKDEINRVIPEAKTLNEKQAVYLQIKKALDKAVARGEGKGIAGTGIGLYDLGVGGLAEIAGVASGHPLMGIAGVALSKSASSPAVLSSVSKLTTYFDTLSPTKKLLFYNAIKGLTIQGIKTNK